MKGKRRFVNRRPRFREGLKVLFVSFFPSRLSSASKKKSSTRSRLFNLRLRTLFYFFRGSLVVGDVVLVLEGAREAQRAQRADGGDLGPGDLLLLGTLRQVVGVHRGALERTVFGRGFRERSLETFPRAFRGEASRDGRGEESRTRRDTNLYRIGG